VISSQEIEEKRGINRNTMYNLEEIKVRWKKAALENCVGAPCSAITVPGAPTGVVATVGNSVSVSFVAPTNNGGRAITGYTVTSNPATSPVTGTTSPINVTGLTNGTAYRFTVIATNDLGNSVASSVSTAVTAFTCGTGTISDIDRNSYNTVLIGTQCWTKENLKVTKYNDGSNIPEINSAGTWDNTIVTGARTVYNDLPANLSTYGYLYNWYAVADSRKLCPTGWHVPTDAEWTTLVTYLNTVAPTGSVGGKMKSTGDNTAGTGLWNSPNTGADNASRFTALPGGNRSSISGSFFSISSDAWIWSATEGGSDAFYRYLSTYSGDVSRNYFSKSVGASVRCLRD
jgi:uncharacterized protein (TIGR02145 family)